jgi:hypothetical protein
MAAMATIKGRDAYATLATADNHEAGQTFIAMPSSKIVRPRLGLMWVWCVCFCEPCDAGLSILQLWHINFGMVWPQIALPQLNTRQCFAPRNDGSG